MRRVFAYQSPSATNDFRPTQFVRIDQTLSAKIELLQLFVISDNLPALRLYQKLGFVEYGIERHATKYRGQYHDDVLMALPLVVESGATASRAPTEEAPA